MELNTRPYHRIVGGHWSDALLIPLLPAGAPNDTTEVEDPMPTPKRPVQSGYHRFRWIQDNRPGMDAEHLMRRYGIPVSSRHIPLIRSEMMEVGFDVPKRQAVWAEYLLCRAGWCLITPLLDPTHHALLEQAWRDGPTRPTGGGKIKRQGITAKFFGIMDELLGIGEATREKMQPPMQQWKRTPAPPLPVSSPSLLDRFLSLFGIRS